MVTIPNSERRYRYAPVSATTNFAVLDIDGNAAPVFDVDDIAVYKDGIRLTTGYSVTATFTDGVSVNAVVVAEAPGWTGTIDIVCDREPSRTDQFQDGRGVPAKDQNLALNRLSAESREHYDRSLRTFLVRPGEPVGEWLAETVGKPIGIDDNGDIVSVEFVGSVVATPFMANVNALADDAPEALSLLDGLAAGIAVFKSAAVADIRDQLDTPVYVATRSALKAIDTTKDTTAILTESGRGGVFIWRTGDYSTHVAADVAEGVYVKATAIADTAGAWVREAAYATWGYNLDWFGRVDGNTTAGVTANNLAMTSAIAVANLVGGGEVVVPVGRTRLDPFTVSVNVWLRGAVQGPWTAGGNPMDYGYAPILLVNSIASNFITLAPSGTGQVSGQISDLFIWYPDSGASPVQNFPTSATPINTLYAVDGPNSGKGGYRVNRCTFGNAYGGVKIQQGRSIVNNNVFGCFLVGLYVDKCRDWVVHNDNMHQVMWNAFNGLAYPQTIDAWVKSNSIGVDIYSADSFEINGLKLFSRYIGMRFLDSSDVSQSPRNSYGRITNVDLDSVAYGVHCRSVNNNGGGVKITNMDIGGYAVVGTAVQASILSDAGGTESGLLQWIGGSVRGSFATGATTIAMSAGKVLAKYVHGLTPYGVMGPPAVPATTVALTNPYPFVCEVHVNGGTVTAIAINGGTTGKTSGTFQVAVGKTITLTYTVAPTWTWFGT